MTTLDDRPLTESAIPRPRRYTKGQAFVKWITSTDHKTIGYMYLIT